MAGILSVEVRSGVPEAIKKPGACPGFDDSRHEKRRLFRVASFGQRAVGLGVLTGISVVEIHASRDHRATYQKCQIICRHLFPPLGETARP